jgi:hypothetical protein
MRWGLVINPATQCSECRRVIGVMTSGADDGFGSLVLSEASHVGLVIRLKRAGRRQAEDCGLKGVCGLHVPNYSRVIASVKGN